MSATCANCGDPFTGTPWQYRAADGARVHVDCDAAASHLATAIADRDAADAHRAARIASYGQFETPTRTTRVPWQQYKKRARRR